MAWYCVSYDLRGDTTRAAYERIGAALQTAADWCKPLLSHWIIQSDRTPASIIAELLRVGAIDDTDGIIVLEITGRGAYRRIGGGDNVIAWLRARIT